ncbi:MAG: RND family transporter, partial [Gammaproteobacteria bacterium]
LERVRTKYEKNGDKVYILGFTKAVGDIIGAAKSVLTYFGLAFFLIMLFTFFYVRSGIITTYVLLSAVVPVIWLLGIMPIVELGLDPLSILVPFLIFAIAVSHAVQMTNAWKLEMAHTNDSTLSAAKSFEKLFLPGSIALIANAIGFMVIAFVDITVVREMAFVATLGVSLMIISNKILLPILLSYCPSNIKFSQSLNASAPLEATWTKLVIIFQKPYLLFILL